MAGPLRPLRKPLHGHGKLVWRIFCLGRDNARDALSGICFLYTVYVYHSLASGKTISIGLPGLQCPGNPKTANQLTNHLVLALTPVAALTNSILPLIPAATTQLCECCLRLQPPIRLLVQRYLSQSESLCWRRIQLLI